MIRVGGETVWMAATQNENPVVLVDLFGSANTQFSVCAKNARNEVLQLDYADNLEDAAALAYAMAVAHDLRLIASRMEFIAEGIKAWGAKNEVGIWRGEWLKSDS